MGYPEALSASDVGAILGMIPSTKPEEDAVEYIESHESLAKAGYETEMAIKIAEAGCYTLKDEQGSEWLSASPSGFIFNGGIVEIVCPYEERERNPPVFNPIYEQMHYYAKVQIKMHVTKTRFCHFYQWSRHGSKLMVIRYDEAWIGEYLPRLYEYYLQGKKKNPCIARVL